MKSKRAEPNQTKLVYFLVAFGAIFLIIGLVFFLIESNLLNSPHIYQQAEVINTRVRQEREAHGVTNYIIRRCYFATFRFSDGTEQEIRIDFSSRDRYQYRVHRTGAYASINIGDRGTLVFQQRGNNTNFVRFEHDTTAHLLSQANSFLALRGLAPIN